MGVSGECKRGRKMQAAKTRLRKSLKDEKMNEFGKEI